MTIKVSREFEQFRGLEISWIHRGRVCKPLSPVNKKYFRNMLQVIIGAGCLVYTTFELKYGITSLDCRAMQIGLAIVAILILLLIFAILLGCKYARKKREEENTEQQEPLGHWNHFSVPSRYIGERDEVCPQNNYLIMNQFM